MKHRFIILFITMLTFQVSISAQNNNSSNEPEGNGCGSENSLGSPDVIEFLEPIGSRDFKNSCNQHDKDYATPGVSKKEADEKFRSNMYQDCKKYSDRDYLDWDNGRRFPSSKNDRKACEVRADRFYRAVDKYGQRAYDAAQRLTNY